MLFIAIIAHKWAESFALGISFYKAKIDTKIFLRMLTLFSFFTPVGILIGMYFSKSGFLIEGTPRMKPSKELRQMYKGNRYIGSIVKLMQEVVLDELYKIS